MASFLPLSLALGLIPVESCTPVWKACVTLQKVSLRCAVGIEDSMHIECRKAQQNKRGGCGTSFVLWFTMGNPKRQEFASVYILLISLELWGGNPSREWLKFASDRRSRSHCLWPCAGSATSVWKCEMKHAKCQEFHQMPLAIVNSRLRCQISNDPPPSSITRLCSENLHSATHDQSKRLVSLLVKCRMSCRFFSFLRSN